MIGRVANGAEELKYGRLQQDDVNGNSVAYILEGGNRIRKGSFAITGGADRMGLITTQDAKATFFSANPSTWSTGRQASSQTYDSRAFPITKQDTFGRRSAYTYSPLDNAVIGKSKPDGYATSKAVNQFRQPLTSTDALGRPMANTFDANGNLLIKIKGVGNPSSATYTWVYNDRGKVTEKRDPLYDANFPDLHNTQYVYNETGYLIEKIEAADATGGERPSTAYTYNESGLISSSTDPAGRVVSYEYDAWNRPIKTTYFDESTEEIEYGTGKFSNLVAARIDRNGIRTEYEYDSAHRVIKTITAAGLPEEIVETCTYLDGTTRKQSCTRRGEKTEYTYNYQNNVVATTRHAVSDIFKTV